MALDDEHSSSQESGLEEIETAELHKAFIEEREIDVHTMLIGRVDRYDRDAQTVDVTPMQNQMIPDGNGGWVSRELPQLLSVPVEWFVCGGFAITMDLIPGDTGILTFSERSISVWRSTGVQSDPGDLGMHTLDGAVFAPTVRTKAKKLTSPAAAGTMAIGSDTNGSGRIVVKPAEIDLGANATNFLAMANKVLTELQKVAATFNPATGHTHSFAAGAVGPPNGGTVYTTASAVASTNAKAEG